MKKITGLLILILILTGCAPAGAPQPAPVTEEGLPTPDSSLVLPLPEATATLSVLIEEQPSSEQILFYPSETRLDIQTVDAVLEAVFTGNRQALSELIYFTQEACTKNDGLGGPPKCKTEEAEGTLVGGFMLLGHEGLVFREEEKEQIIDALLYGKPALYAVIETPNEVIMEEDWLPAQYAIVFVDQINYFGRAVMVDKNGILRIASFNTLTDLFERVNGGVILPPLGN